MVALSLESRIEMFDTFVIESARFVASTMLDWTFEESRPEPVSELSSFTLHGINGCIGFVGQFTGSIFLSCSAATAERMAGILFGVNQPSPQDVSDVVAELTNMLAGGCKSRLCDHGCPVVMSIPTIIRGQGIRATSPGSAFVLKRCFAVPISGETLQATISGRFA